MKLGGARAQCVDQGQVATVGLFDDGRYFDALRTLFFEETLQVIDGIAPTVTLICDITLE